MQLDFRVDWGYQYLYSRRHYHPTYIWDGTLSCDKGTIEETYTLDYPVLWYGPGHSAKETLLDKPCWTDKTKRGLSGIRVKADVAQDAQFTLQTVSGTFVFSAADILEKGRIEFAVGPKYQGCFVTVTKTGYYWFRRPLPADAVVFDADTNLPLPTRDWSRMRLGWLAPQETVSFEINVPKSDADLQETVMHTLAMAAPDFDTESEQPMVGDITLEMTCDGAHLRTFTRHYRFHDQFMQILEDEWQRFELPAGKHVLTVKNLHPELSLAFSRVAFTFSLRNHGQLSIPAWALVNETVFGKVFATKAQTIAVTIGDTVQNVPCVNGWNEFSICSKTAGDVTVATDTDAGSIAVIDAKEEAVPVKVGYDMTEIPHDDNGFMDWLLDYTQRTRLGNYVVFRSFNGPYPPALAEKWGDYCRTHGIYVSCCKFYEDGALIKGAGDMFNDCGPHEYSGTVYARDPKDLASDCMKEASEKFRQHLRVKYDEIHTLTPVAAMGDASGGIRYSFLEGADSVRAETMVGHTMTLLSQARPAAEALSTGRWGVHIAIQHHYQPYRDTHIGQYFLSLLQPWVMGAENIYEEDSLFGLWKEERQCWDDVLVKGKRDMTRNFFRFAKTHPRKGKNVRNIGFIEGRYAAPFNGFIAGSEQDPHYSVWGAYGNEKPEWGHGQPEKCRQLLDVLMPGANTHPLRQQYDKRRFFFSGTPYGDFDCVPTEATVDYLNRYRLLLHLGWNTMIAEDYEKLTAFVQNGGTLLIGIPQFFENTDRDFLSDMDKARIWNNGDLRAICGLTVNGKGDVYSGQWNAANRENMPAPILSAAPNDSVFEDGAPYLADVTLEGAKVVAWDKASGKPMLVKHTLGKGTVYTFTLWAYPGHELFQSFSASVIAHLCDTHKSDMYVEDTSGEVFWTRWDDGDTTTLMLLNTDWTVEGNQKAVKIVTPNDEKAVWVTEQAVLFVHITDGKIEKTEQFTL